MPGHGGVMTDLAAPLSSNELAEARTKLAVERSFIAFERTLMAWLRTALSMIGFGFTLAKFFQYLAEQRGAAIVGRFGATWAADTVGLTMITIGAVSLVLAVLQHHRRLVALKAYGLVPQWNLALWVAGMVAALGVLAFVSLVLPG